MSPGRKTLSLSSEDVTVNIVVKVPGSWKTHIEGLVSEKNRLSSGKKKPHSLSSEVQRVLQKEFHLKKLRNQ